MERIQARNVYRWLLWSPLLILPTIVFLYLSIADYEEVPAILMAGLWHLVLLKSAIDHKHEFVRWHARQALLIGVVATIGIYLGYELFDEGTLWLVFILPWLGAWWGGRQALKGNCSLMRWSGNADNLPDADIITIDSPEELEFIELKQLEYLLEETASWNVPKKLRAPYRVKLNRLREKFNLPIISEPKPVETTPATKPSVAAVKPKPASKPTSKKEQVPFDQWLLSERNIKIALYGGAGLLILAGLIFIGRNWSVIPGPAKFTITVFISGLMYLGGFLLFQRDAFRLGGNALLGIASGFFALNFAVLQIYVLGPNGVRPDITWLIASPICMLLYMLTAYWTKSELFTYISLGALGSIATAALVVANALPLVFLLSYVILILVVFLLIHPLQSSQFAAYTVKPLIWVTQIVMPLVILAAFGIWVVETDCRSCSAGSPWLAIVALVFGVIFYLLTDIFTKKIIARWVVAGLFVIMIVAVINELNFGKTAQAMTLMIFALAYLWAGNFIEERSGQKKQGMSLYIVGYIIAGGVTLLAVDSGDIDDIAKVFFGNVVLLSVSAYFHKDYRWVYVAVWTLILPIYLVIDILVTGILNKGLFMGLLGLNYAIIGYVLGRRKLRLGGPFLTAAAFLTIVTIIMTYPSFVIGSIVLIAVALLYLFAAFWIDWKWLLLPALGVISLAVLSVNNDFYTTYKTYEIATTISFALLGLILAIGGSALRKSNAKEWGWPLYIAAGFDLGGAYLFSLFSLGGWMAIAWSVIVAILLLSLAWAEKDYFADKNYPPILTYLGIVTIFIGQFFLLEQQFGWRKASDIWPPYTAGLLSLFIVISWGVRNSALADVYEAPFRRNGLVLMLVPLVGTLIIFDPILGAITFGIAGLIFAADAGVRRIVNQAYLSLGAFVIVIWAILQALDISDLQAYAIPLGIALLGAGWYERAKVEDHFFRPFTILGLIVLMGSAFVQSLEEGGAVYALILAVESLGAIIWGVKSRSRGYVQLGGLALLANAVAQLGPAFTDLPRWIQIGSIGGILLGLGMGALLKREQLLETRKKLTDEWRSWNS